MLSGFKFYKWGVFYTLLILLFSFFLSERSQNILGLLFTLGIGLLHGANDLKIIQQFSIVQTNSTSNYFIIYIGVVLLGGVLFYWIPQTALPLFVIVSAFHFGEQHWEIRLNKISNKRIFYLCYGGFIFSLLFFLQAGPSSAIIKQIVEFDISFQIWKITLIVFGAILLLCFLFYKPLRLFILWESLLLVLLTFVFWKGSLLLAFATYFVFWHSLPSLQSQMQYLYGSANYRAWWNYFKSGALYWSLALTSLGIAYGLIDFSQPYFLSLFFVFLAAITFPHALVMELMFGKKE
ncbi:MAG: Brp/Blh family beta-carotene 15,15'-dioxygenase [Flavobacteriaceae bacterium]